MPLNLAISALFIISFRKKSYSLFLTTLFLTFFSNGLVNELFNRLVEYPWERLSPKEIPSADAIVVLSQRRHMPPGKSNIIEWWDDPDRFMSGLMLIKSKKANKIIFTGGHSPFYPELPLEGNIYKKEAISFGIPKKQIFTTGAVKNTYEESKAIKKIISNKNSTIILVTSASHMNRSKKLFERNSINVIPYPVDFKSNKRLGFAKLLNPNYFIPNAESLSSTSSAIREFMGRLKYNTF